MKLRPKLTLLALTGLNLVNYLDRQVLPAVLQPLQEDLKLDKTQAGFATTAFMLGYFATAPFFGALGDRLARKWLIAAGVVVWSVGTILTGAAGGIVSLLLYRCLVGVGEASYGTLSPGWIADLFSSRQRNNALSFFYVAIPIGSALGYLLGGEIGHSHGWRAAFYVAGVPGLVFGLVLLGLKEPQRGASDASASDSAGAAPPAGGWRAYKRLLKNRPYLLVVFGYVAQTFAVGGFAAWAPSFLQEVRGMEFRDADRFFGIALAATGLGATVLGGLASSAWQRRSRSGYAATLGLSALVAAPLAFAAFMDRDVARARVLLVATMFCLFFATGPVNTLLLETVPATMRSSAMAASIFAIHLFGDLWSPALVGYVAEKTSFESAVLILPAALVVSAAAWLVLIGVVRRTAPAASSA
jgi:MFS family permease